MKKCALCRSLFSRLSNKARFCSKACKDKSWYLKNKASKQEYGREYYLNNKKAINRRTTKNAYKYKDYQKEANRQWREDNPGYQNSYSKNRKVVDLNFKLTLSLRTRLNSAIRGNYKSGSAISDLGCSIEELKQHLESQFQPGMTWNNWSRDGWHIDHIKPLANFDLTKEEELKKACHYTNIQPLWAEDNLSKGNKNE